VPSKYNVAEAFQDPKLFVSSAVILLIDNFGTEVIHWDPAAIQTELEETFNIKVSRRLNDKINSGLSLLASDLYHRSLEAFTAINNGMNFKTVSDKQISFSTLDDIMRGVTEARLLEGPEIYDAAGFSHPIARYTGELLASEGITNPPNALEFAEFDEEESAQRDISLAGDILMAESYWSKQDEERKELNAIANERMENVIEQIRKLPLQNGELSEAFTSM
jgi:hypothetical protein